MNAIGSSNNSGVGSGWLDINEKNCKNTELGVSSEEEHCAEQEGLESISIPGHDPFRFSRDWTPWKGHPIEMSARKSLVQEIKDEELADL